jgi:hypothetical protein
MNKECIPYEESLILYEELGFNESCYAVYSEHDQTRVYDKDSIKEGKIIPAPTFYQVFRFFRENHNLSFSASQRKTSGLTYWEIIFIDKFESAMYGSPSHPTDTKISGINSTYYLAEQEGLKKLIEIVKN